MLGSAGGGARGCLHRGWGIWFSAGIPRFGSRVWMMRVMGSVPGELDGCSMGGDEDVDVECHCEIGLFGRRRRLSGQTGRIWRFAIFYTSPLIYIYIYIFFSHSVGNSPSCSGLTCSNSLTWVVAKLLFLAVAMAKAKGTLSQSAIFRNPRRAKLIGADVAGDACSRLSQAS